MDRLSMRCALCDESETRWVPMLGAYLCEPCADEVITRAREALRKERR